MDNLKKDIKELRDEINELLGAENKINFLLRAAREKTLQLNRLKEKYYNNENVKKEVNSLLRAEREKTLQLNRLKVDFILIIVKFEPYKRKLNTYLEKIEDVMGRIKKYSRTKSYLKDNFKSIECILDDSDKLREFEDFLTDFCQRIINGEPLIRTKYGFIEKIKEIQSICGAIIEKEDELARIESEIGAVKLKINEFLSSANPNEVNTYLDDLEQKQRDLEIKKEQIEQALNEKKGGFTSELNLIKNMRKEEVKAILSTQLENIKLNIKSIEECSENLISSVNDLQDSLECLKEEGKALLKEYFDSIKPSIEENTEKERLIKLPISEKPTISIKIADQLIGKAIEEKRDGAIITKTTLSKWRRDIEHVRTPLNTPDLKLIISKLEEHKRGMGDGYPEKELIGSILENLYSDNPKIIII